MVRVFERVGPRDAFRFGRPSVAIEREADMSAVAAWERPLTLRHRAPRLQVVDAGPPTWSRFLAGRHDSPAHARTDPRTVRVTARGRLAATLGVFAVVAFAVLGWREQAAASTDARTVVVVQGQSLTDIAQRELSSIPVPDAIARIRYANQMNSTDLRAGQLVLVPSLP